MARPIFVMLVGLAPMVAVGAGSPARAFARAGVPFVAIAFGTYAQGGGEGPEIGTQLGWGSLQTQVIGNLPVQPGTTCAVGSPARFRQSVAHRASNGDQLFATNELTGCLVQGGVSRLTGSETVTGGTGRFVGANGTISTAVVLDDTTDPVPLSGRFRVTRYGTITVAR